MRRRVLPRLAQLFQSEPHLTNRYLNALLFARHHQVNAWEEFRDAIQPSAVQELELLEWRSPHRSPVSAPAARLARSGAWATVTLAILIGVAFALPSDDVVSDGDRPALTRGRSGVVFAGSSTPLLTIPDEDETGLSDEIAIHEDGSVRSVEVTVSITHSRLSGFRRRYELRVTGAA